MPNDLQKIAFLPDTHCPYHSRRNVDLFLRCMEWWKPDILVILGDLADFYKISSFGKHPNREHSFEDEIIECCALLDALDDLSQSRKIFIEGNHENRLVRYLQDKAPELFPFIDVPKLFKLKERGYEFTPYKQATRLGKLWITHDVGTAGRYSVFRAADTFQHPIVMAHTHRLVYIVEGNATGETFPAVQFGWLGDIDQVDYMHQVVARRSWSPAFGTGLLDEKTGYVYLAPHPIVEGTVVIDGRRFS